MNQLHELKGKTGDLRVADPTKWELLPEAEAALATERRMREEGA